MKIAQWRGAGRAFEESLILDWFIQLTTAVRYIHDRRILHRDLKTRWGAGWSVNFFTVFLFYMLLL